MNPQIVIVLKIVGIGALICTYVIAYAIAANREAEEKARTGKVFSFAGFGLKYLMLTFKTKAGRITLAIFAALLALFLCL